MKSAVTFVGPHLHPGGWRQRGTTVLMPALVAPSISCTRRPRAGSDDNAASSVPFLILLKILTFWGCSTSA